MKRRITLALLGLACLMAMPSIAEARYADGMNLYEFVGGRPTGMVDPMGLEDSYFSHRGYTMRMNEKGSVYYIPLEGNPRWTTKKKAVALIDKYKSKHRCTVTILWGHGSTRESGADVQRG